MQFTKLAAFACLVISASAFDFPDFVPLHRRQSPGTPEYDCHANCGGVIVSARSDNFCDSSSFKTQLSDCLECANEFDIWKYYGGSVSKAAKSCGLDATPQDADDEDKDDSSATTQSASTTRSESIDSTTKPSTEATVTSVEAAATSAGLDTTSLSATQALTTTAPVAGSSHLIIPTGSTLISESTTPTRHATPSPSSSDVPLFNSATSIHGNIWIGLAAGSLVATLMCI